MPSQPEEAPAQDLAHIIQYAQLASLLLCDRRTEVGHAKRRITLTIQDENNLLDLLNDIEARAKAATEKLKPAPLPAGVLFSEHTRYLGALGLLGECAVHVPEDLRESIERAMTDACAAQPTALRWHRILDRIEIEAVR